VSTLALRAYKRAFEAHAKDLGAAGDSFTRQAGEPGKRPAVERLGGGDHGRQEGDGPRSRKLLRELRHASGLGGDVHTKRPVHLQVHETRRYQAIVVRVDLAGFEELAAHARDAAPFEEDRTLRPKPHAP
jgi:hypothetical protein